MNDPVADLANDLPGDEIAVGREFCVFSYAGVHYALVLDAVKEAIRLPLGCPITFSHESVIGMVNLRGTPLPAIDAFAAADMPGLRMKGVSAGVAVDWLVLDGQSPACMRVEQVGFVDRIADETIEPLGSHPCLAGIARIRGLDVVVLNAQQLLSCFGAMAS